MKPETTQDDPVLEALKLGRQYVAGVEGTIPIKPNICTPDREKIERAIAIQEAQMTVLKTARKYLEFQRALPGSSTEDYAIWSELDDDFIALDKLKEGK